MVYCSTEMKNRLKKFGIVAILAIWLAIAIGSAAHVHKSEIDSRHCAICHFYSSSLSVAIAPLVSLGITFLILGLVSRCDTSKLIQRSFSALSRGPPRFV